MNSQIIEIYYIILCLFQNAINIMYKQYSNELRKKLVPVLTTTKEALEKKQVLTRRLDT